MKLLANNATVTLEYDDKEEHPDIRLEIKTKDGKMLFKSLYASRSSKTEITNTIGNWSIIE